MSVLTKPIAEFIISPKYLNRKVIKITKQSNVNKFL